MIVIHEKCDARKNFVEKLCKSLNIQCLIDKHNIKIFDNTANLVTMSYEDWVGKNFKRGLVYQEIGEMRIMGTIKEILVPTKQGGEWMSYKCFQPQVTITKVPFTHERELTKILGLPDNTVGYFSVDSRPVLYDSSWKIIEITMEQIAEKFGVSSKQIRIKE